MSETSDNAELLGWLDYFANDYDTRQSVQYWSSRGAAAIRALEAKVAELQRQRSEFDCRFAGRYWEASGSHCPDDRTCLRCDRDRLAAEVERLKRLVIEPSEAEAALFDAKAEIMKWQVYFAQLLAFMEEQHDRHAAEVAALREERTVLAAGLEAVDALIHDSFGVAGLHLNGEVASWESLLEGGEFEAWLSAYCDALVAARKGGR